ncbi:Ltp1p [Saccharomyces cerevisiae YJM1133]|nr:Ltp1p [Saccharomyces cerevisiae YJM1133]
MTIEKPKISVAFICLGNFCRSPMAEAIFKHEVEKANLENRFNKIDSFGTSNYHVGESPDHRTVSICKQHGVKINHKGKQIKTKHFDEYDYIIGMDESNINNLKKIQPEGSKAKVCLFGDWNTNDGTVQTIIEDPWYGDIQDFEYNFKQITYFSEQFLKKEL